MKKTFAAAFPGEDSKKLTARALGSVNKNDELKNLCVTGGGVNLRNALEEKYSPVIFDAQIEGSKLIVDGEFFSSSGELYINDTLVSTIESGNNKIIASAQDIDLSKRFIKNDKSFRPPVKNKVENIDEYDTIVMGFPVWWYTAPTIINTFIEENNLGGKDVYVFETSGSSGSEGSFNDLLG